MHIYLLVLRIIHITCGVFWAGTALLMVFYIFPAVGRSGPDGGKIMQAITGTNKFPQVLTLVATLTLLSGYLLLWQLSAGFTPAWFTSKYGMALSTGGFTATIAFLQVMFINLPTIKRTQAIGQMVASKGGTPSEEQRTELMKLRNRVFLSTRWIAAWLLIAVITMAGARYF
jgi:hypothetical protein